VSADPGYPYVVEALAQCDVSGPGECQAVTDPVFEFDQATFDAQMGASTFSLADYYGLEYSPNLAPEPSSAGLICAALLGVAYAVRRKHAVSPITTNGQMR
jgi:hypothetical protein